MVGACGPGGYEGLCELAESYPDEFAWELHKLGIKVEAIGDDETYSEEQRAQAVDHVLVDRLLRVVTRDPSSHLYAAMHGWDFPASREWLQNADLFDALNALLHVEAQVKRKPKPYPRPWKDNDTSQLGRTSLSPAEAREVLQQNRG